MFTATQPQALNASHPVPLAAAAPSGRCTSLHGLRRVASQLAWRTRNPDKVDDLQSVGMYALVEAAERFDASRGVPFAAFADRRVRGAMMDELRRNDHLPRRLRRLERSASRTRQVLATRLGRPARDEEVAACLGMAPDEVTALEAVSAPPVALVDGWESAAQEPGPEDLAAAGEVSGRLHGALGALPERLQCVMVLRYFRDMSMRDIGRQLGVSEQRVHQLHARALELLRTSMDPA